MTAKQFKAALEALGLTQVAVARLLRYDERTSRRWCLRERGVPPAVELLIWLLEEGELSVATIARITAKRGRR